MFLVQEIGQCLGVETKNNVTLWRDRVATEISQAVLHSFTKAGVTLVDHHTQSDQFMTFFKQEHKDRGGCPADWVWISPPQSGSLTEVFHQEMLNYHLTPAYDYQVPYILHAYPIADRITKQNVS